MAPPGGSAGTWANGGLDAAKTPSAWSPASALIAAATAAATSSAEPPAAVGTASATRAACEQEPRLPGGYVGGAEFGFGYTDTPTIGSTGRR